MVAQVGLSSAAAHGGKTETVGETGQNAVGEKQKGAADHRHQQVDEGRPAILRVVVLKNHEEIAGDRHQLPGEHEGEGIGGQQHQQHAGDKQAGEQCQGAETGCGPSICSRT